MQLHSCGVLYITGEFIKDIIELLSLRAEERVAILTLRLDSPPQQQVQHQPRASRNPLLAGRMVEGVRV